MISEAPNHADTERRSWAGVTNLTHMRAQAKHPCEAVPDNDYTRLLSKMPKPGHRGVNSANLIDKSPPILGELANYFARLKNPQLAACWVACIVDQCIGTDVSPGEMARALIVVAERLHGVRFEQPIEVASPLRLVGKEAPMSQTAHQAAFDERQRLQTKATPIVPDVTLPGGFKLGNGEPPPSAVAPKGPAAELLMACTALPAGGWFIIERDRVKKMTRAVVNRYAKKRSLPVICYPLADGRLVVKNTGNDATPAKKSA